jgi:hypothetical protein
LDQEALRVCEHAYYIGVQVEKDGPPITFSTLLLALLTAEDETSRWFQEFARSAGPNAQAVCAGKDTTLEAVNKSRRTGKPESMRLAADQQLLTVSARSVMGTAEEWALRVHGSDIGVRHLVASYVLNPPAAHRKQLAGWNFRERPWREAFFEWAARRYTAEAWEDASARAAPSKAVASFEQTTVKAESLAIAKDAQATPILKRAADYHARRSDSWLKLQTLFFALVDVVREDAAIGAVVSPLRDQIQAVDVGYQAAAEKYFADTTTKSAIVSFDDLDISPRVLNALETARELGVFAGRDGDQLGVLQLAGALVSRRVDGDEALTNLGLDPRALRLAIIERAAVIGESGDIWREALGEQEIATVGRPADLNSDEPDAVVRADPGWTNDPLHIRSDVFSFAALIASKTLEPPLSIGLFGPWGSGKTTFLRRLRQVIDERANESKTAQEKSQPTPYVTNVVHVEFNAWHFSEDALISSLVDTILRDVRAFIKDDYPKVGQALAKMRAETADVARRRVEQAKEAERTARHAVATAATTLSTHESEARRQAVKLERVVEAVWASVRVAVENTENVKKSGILEKIGETVKGIDDLKTRLASISGRSKGMLGSLGWARTMLFALLLLALPPAAVWLVKSIVSVGQVGEAMVLVSGLLSAGGLWLRSASAVASQVDAAIAEVVTAYENRVRNDAGVKTAEAQLATATEQARQAADALATAQRELQNAEADAASATLPAQMLQLAERRVNDMVYAKELTTISIARGDLQSLSEILRKEVEGHTTPSPSGRLRPVDRVVLYIDDLDRCRPEDVVRVLQVVHMLLAFELFVVVVAVDSRWVEESLKHNYAWLSAPSPHRNPPAQPLERSTPSPDEPRALVTPQDYLEKIFQISFRLAPLTSANAAEFMRSLVRTGPRIEGVVDGRPASVTPAAGQLAVGKIEIEPIELDYMCALAAYVGPSPRRVKRLVNAYRLLKARLSEAQLRTFLAERQADGGGVSSGPYQLVIALLAIGTGVPASSAEIFTDLSERDPTDQMSSCIAEFRQKGGPDWMLAAQVLETLIRTQKPRNMSELRGWARSVGRFLLRGPELLG